jgi:Mn2+/Fe2+ NRAMP family transporter
MVLTLFVLISLTVFIAIGQPVKILVTVGALNGFILPIALLLILAASYNKNIVGTYRHPLWLKLFGWMVMITTLLLSIRSFI